VHLRQGALPLPRIECVCTENFIDIARVDALHAHHTQQPSLLLESGTASQNASHHDDGAGEDQDVGGRGVGLGGQEADVVALLHEGPHAHRHHHAPRHLAEAQISLLEPQV